MKKLNILLLAISMGLTSCNTVKGKEPIFPKTEKLSMYKKIKARITYYHPEAPYWRKVSDPKAKVATEGVTIAAHPDFKFGKKIYIPTLKDKLDDGIFTVQDRGTAVTKKKASKATAYVFDVYVKTSSKMNYLAKNSPMWMDVYVLE